MLILSEPDSSRIMRKRSTELKDLYFGIEPHILKKDIKFICRLLLPRTRPAQPESVCRRKDSQYE